MKPTYRTIAYYCKTAYYFKTAYTKTGYTKKADMKSA